MSISKKKQQEVVVNINNKRLIGKIIGRTTNKAYLVDTQDGRVSVFSHQLKVYHGETKEEEVIQGETDS